MFMEKLDNFIARIYSNARSMMYFYIILGAIALFFIILIIITLIKSSKESKKELNKVIQVDDNQKQVTSLDKNVSSQITAEEKQKEEAKEEVKNENSLSETQIFNNTLMNKENNDLFPETSNQEIQTINETSNTLKEEKSTEEEVKKTINPVDILNVYLENDKFVSNDNKKEETIINTNTNQEKVRDDYTIEMPAVKAMDIDDYLFRRENENIQNTPVEEEKINVEIEPATSMNFSVEPDLPKMATVSNDELEERLAKLDEESTSEEVNHNENNQSIDNELDDLFKAVGLEETMQIPKLKGEK